MNPTPSFNINPKQTPESLQRRRDAIAQMMASQGPAQNWGEGLGALMGGLGAGVARYGVNRDEAAMRQSGDADFNRVMGNPGSVGGPGQNQGFPQAPADASPSFLSGLKSFFTNKQNGGLF